MTAARTSLSFSPELLAILRSTAKDQGLEVSRLVETLLRENPLIQQQVAQRRNAPSQTKRGRDPRELWILGQVAQRQWKDSVESGQIKPPRPTPA